MAIHHWLRDLLSKLILSQEEEVEKQGFQLGWSVEQNWSWEAEPVVCLGLEHLLLAK